MGGAGVSFAGTGATFTNSGAVTGGAGGQAGGAGVSFTGADAIFTNSGTVTGGAGVVGVGRNAVGGAGVSFAGTGAMFTNSGAVIGGAGGFAFNNRFFGEGGMGVIGSGLTIINSGTISAGVSGDGVVRANAITFTDGTNILEVRAGSTIIGNVVGTGADTFRLGGAVNAAFDASGIGTQYQGFSSIRKVGSSAFTVTGATNAPTPWSIDQGELIVNGSIASSSLTTVNNSGTLSGVGTVGNLVVNDGGTFAPGTAGAPATMTVAGNLTFSPGASYNVDLTAPSSANVTGTATLAGTVNATIGTGSNLRKSYHILHADGGFGNTRFGVSNVVGAPPNFNETLSYTSTDVLLGLTAALGASSVLPGNPRRVADALDNYFNSGGALPPNFVELYGLTGSTLSNALAFLSGEAATGAQQAAFQSTRQFLGLMLDPMVVARSETASAPTSALAFAPERAPLPERIARAYASVLKGQEPSSPAARESLWTSWAGSFGGQGRLAGNASGTGTHDLSASVAGVAAGFDYRVMPETILGVAVAGGGTNWGLAQGLGSGRSDFFQTGLYAATRSGPAYLSGAFGFANHWASTARLVTFGDFLAGSFEGQSYGGRVEGGYHLATPAGVAPYAAVQAQGFVMPAYRETGPSGGFGLSYNGRTATDTRIELGARFDHAVAIDDAATLALRGRLAFAHDWVSNPTLTAAFETLPGSGFIVVGAKPVKNAALVSGGVELLLVDALTIGVRFDGEFASRASIYAGTGILRYSW